MLWGWSVKYLIPSYLFAIIKVSFWKRKKKSWHNKHIHMLWKDEGWSFTADLSYFFQNTFHHCRCTFFFCNQMKDVTKDVRIWSCDLWLNVCSPAKWAALYPSSKLVCLEFFFQPEFKTNDHNFENEWMTVYDNAYIILFVQWTCSVVSFHTISLYHCVNVLAAQSHTPALRVEGDSCVLLVLSSGPHPQSTPTSPLFPKLDFIDS